MLISLNSYLNLFVLNKNFPDKLPGKSFQIFYRVLFILNLLIVLGIIIIFYLELDSIFKNESIKLSDDIPYITFLLVILVVLAYTVTVQYQLMSFLKKNHEASLKKLIDSIGKETND
jgi:hypothetical protein